MIPLSDPKWSDFKANYTNGAQVAGLLARAEAGEVAHRWYDDLFQELCHQYTVSPAAYPAAPHLARLARARAEIRKDLLVLLGVCHAFSDPSDVRSLPSPILEGWQSSARDALPLLARLLEERQPTASDLLYLLSALAALSGYHGLARAIEAVDCEPE